MAKLVLNDITDGDHATAMNSNMDAIEIAIDNTLSLDGTTPNSMTANLDMNSNKVINLPEAVGDTEAVQYRQLQTLLNQLTLGEDPKWEVQTTSVEMRPEDKYYMQAASSLTVTVQASMPAGNQVTIHNAVSSTFDVQVDPVGYTIRGPLATVVSPDTLALAAGETVVLVHDGNNILEIV